MKLGARPSFLAARYSSSRKNFLRPLFFFGFLKGLSRDAEDREGEASLLRFGTNKARPPISEDEVAGNDEVRMASLSRDLSLAEASKGAPELGASRGGRGGGA